jgi:hypothetical protein
MTPHHKSQLMDRPAWEEHKLYMIGSLLARKIGEPWKYSELEGCYCTHHQLHLQTDQVVTVTWKQMLEWATKEIAEKVHLRRDETIRLVKLAERGDMDWATVMRKIKAKGPIAQDVGDVPALAGEGRNHG